MIVASIDTETGRTALISLPRNLLKAPLAPGSPLRALYPCGRSARPTALRPGRPRPTSACSTPLDRGGRSTARPPGRLPRRPCPAATRSATSSPEIVGLKIDQMVVIDLKGFSQLIDAMGGARHQRQAERQRHQAADRRPHAADGGVVGVKGYFSPAASTSTANTGPLVRPHPRRRQRHLPPGAPALRRPGDRRAGQPGADGLEVPRARPDRSRTTSTPTSRRRTCRPSSTSSSGCRRRRSTACPDAEARTSTPATPTTPRSASWSRRASRRRRRRPTPSVDIRPRRRRRRRPRPPTTHRPYETC